MLSDDKIKRINYLAKKKKESGLSSEELSEQKQLQQEYIQNLRKGLSNHIEGLKIVDAKGNDLTSKKVKQIQKEKGLHNRK